ncbi:TonB-dependent siderophore receptor [Myroides profundi]|uniref:Iron complex outermembrane recepter protein n=1 Tax=Myroides profundi TaxID=480520 RepID=A0AAJ5BEH8_MYRPR|nr:TonB-dependent siderophore receptor [Myroides profundi]AJH14324.1 iron complex outermembrane recepter protein [Myroides profundi]SER15648.1 iron complex outermembrane recepter protein [Myroides profundi]
MNKHIISLSLLMLISSHGLLAQEVKDSLKMSSQQLENVVITLENSPFVKKKTSESLRLSQAIENVPQNIQVISNELIEARQITTLTDGITRNVSGAVRLEEWGDVYARINMRGARASAFRNGMNVSSTYGPMAEDMSFVDHIEFVKGPAGFMMSNGEPSGIYNVVTKKPTEQTRQRIEVNYGSFDFMRASADVEGNLTPVSDKVFYRINLMGSSKNGYRDFQFNKRIAFAPSFLFKLSDKTTLKTEYVYQRLKLADFGADYLFSKEGFATLPRKRSFGDPGFEPSVMNDHSFNAHLKTKLDDQWTLNAQVGYFKFDQEGQYMWVTHIDDKGDFVRTSNLWDAENTTTVGQVFVNGEVETGAIKHKILGGVDMGHKRYIVDWSQKFDYDDIGTFNIYNDAYQKPVHGYPQFDRSKPLRQRVAEYGIGQADVGQSYTGVYVQDEMAFFEEKLFVTVAGRYTTVKENGNRDNRSNNKFTPRFGVSYKLGYHTNLYGLYDQTFVPQTGIKKDGSSVTPLTGHNIEFGVKNNLFNKRLQSTVSLYSITKNNHLSNDPSNAPGESYVLQLGQTRTQGVEVDITGRLAKGLNINLNYAYTDSEVTKATKGAEKGTKVSGYAKHIANAWVDYTIEDGLLKNLSFMGGVTFMGDRQTWAFGGGSGDPLPDYTRVDVGASWKKDDLKVSLLVNNLFDRYLYNGAYYNSRGGFYYWRPEDPINLKLSLSYSF